jgi:hypothetical protein
MKKTALLFCFFLSSIPSFAQFYKDYPESLRKELAEAYYLVGERYLELGYAQGERYKKQAFEMYPALEPESIARSESGREGGNGAEKFTGTGVTGGAVRVKNLLAFSFARFLGALASKDTTRLGIFVYDAKGDTPGNATSKEEMLGRLENLVCDFPVPGFSPFDVYDFDSLSIEPTVSKIAGNPRAEYVLHIRIKDGYAKSVLGFEKDEQEFVYRRSGNSYLIASIDGLYGTGRIEEVPPDISRKIREAFGECIESFLRQDVKSAVEHLGPEVAIFPMRTSITRDEVSVTFTGYFSDEHYRASNAGLSDILDSPGTVVKGTRVLGDRFPQGVYRLVPSFKKDYIPKIPFFSQYQMFYFTFIKDDWVIIAVN